jgi:PAS domain S-box-containing protein
MRLNQPELRKPKKKAGISLPLKKEKTAAKDRRSAGHALAEERLKESEAEYRRLFEDPLIGISQALPNGRLIRVNTTYARMYGYADPDELIAEINNIGRQLYAHPDERREVLRILNEKGTPAPREFCVVRRDGTRIYVAVAARAVKDPSGKLRYYQATHIDITEQKRAEQALRESESNLRALAMELSRTEERERQRLAVCLHDEIGQSLALVRLKLGGLAAASKSRSDKRSMGALRDLLETVIDQTHALIFELSPPVLHQLGLAAAIEWAGEKIGRDYGLHFQFDDDGVAKSLNSDLQAILFRCVRELMLNTAKHAKAKLLTVAITRKDETTFFTVADDGIGFDALLQSTRTESRGYGLFSVREHLATLGGSCRIQSAPGQGTRITLTVPVTDRTPREHDAAARSTLGQIVRKNEPR